MHWFFCDCNWFDEIVTLTIFPVQILLHSQYFQLKFSYAHNISSLNSVTFTIFPVEIWLHSQKNQCKFCYAHIFFSWNLGPLTEKSVKILKFICSYPSHFEGSRGPKGLEFHRIFWALTYQKFVFLCIVPLSNMLSWPWDGTYTCLIYIL